jgi:hypothetical protein
MRNGPLVVGLGGMPVTVSVVVEKPLGGFPTGRLLLRWILAG